MTPNGVDYHALFSFLDLFAMFFSVASHAQWNNIKSVFWSIAQGVMIVLGWFIALLAFALSDRLKIAIPYCRVNGIMSGVCAGILLMPFLHPSVDGALVFTPIVLVLIFILVSILVCVFGVVLLATFLYAWALSVFGVVHPPTFFADREVSIFRLFRFAEVGYIFHRLAFGTAFFHLATTFHGNRKPVLKLVA